MKTMTREGLLKDLEVQGKKAANYVANGAWEGWNTEHAVKVVAALRVAYRLIKDGGHMAAALRQAYKVVSPSIEGNHISLLIDAVSTGFTPEQWWIVENDQLTFNPKPAPEDGSQWGMNK
jgi:hypothetical protein